MRVAVDELGLPAGYAINAKPAHCEARALSEREVTWQPDVYALARALARATGARALIDLGCGAGDKLIDCHPELEIVGVDLPQTVEYCRATRGVGTWLAADLEKPFSIEGNPALLESAGLVCADVIEHLVDPRPLLSSLRALLERCPFLVLSTPERARTHGPGHMGPPTNPAHVREWTLDELEALLRAAGLPPWSIGLTRANDRQEVLATTTVVVAGRGFADALGGAR